MRRSKLIFAIIYCFASSVKAADLMDVYRHALENDPTFKAAYSTYMASTEAIPQAISALLPQLSANSQISRNQVNVKTAGFGTDETYNSHMWQLTASQVIFNYKYWATILEAKASVKVAAATFNNAAQDLILRTATAYFDVLFATDTLKFAEAKLRANKRQMEQAQIRFDVGMDPIASVYEAKAAYDQSIAEVIAAKNNKMNQNENLRKLTNVVYESLASLRDSTVPLITPEPNDANEWIEAAINQNYNLLAAKYSLIVARENVKAINASNWPNLSLQGNSAKTYNSGGAGNFFVPSIQETNSVALALNVPFFQGGLVESQTRQAQYNFQTSSEQFEKTYRDVSVNSQIAFNTIIDGISKVKADRQTVVSRVNSLQSTEAEFEVGTRIMVDVVNAQEKLFEAQEQLARDQYGYIKAILFLKYLAGSLNVDDLAQINSWLDTIRIASFPP